MIEYRQPFEGEWPISQQYGEIIEGVTVGKAHTGIDYACPNGTPILASADGIVMAASLDGSGYGLRVIIQHEARKSTLYAHLSALNCSAHDEVKQGDVIGYSGWTGNVVPKGEAGAHLHFEARRIWWDASSHQDPVTYLPLMSFAQGAGSGEQGADVVHGECRVVCEAAFVRDWDTLTRQKQVYRGTRVYVFNRYRVKDGLRFYFIGAGMAMAAVDQEGTVILEEVHGEE